MKIISIANQKGGVGKSTTTYAMGAGLIKKGFKVLFLDLDPQINLTISMGIRKIKNTIYEVLAGKVDINNAIQKADEIDIISGNEFLCNADAEFNTPGKGGEYKLKKALKNLNIDYDYILIDTPPALGILTVNALTASDYVIIPAEADTFSIQGIMQLKSTIDGVREYCNPNLTIKGILLTRYSRTILSRDLAEIIGEIADEIKTFVYKSPIRECISLKEAKTQKKDIFAYAPKSNAAKDYEEFLDEFLKGGK